MQRIVTKLFTYPQYVLGRDPPCYIFKHIHKVTSPISLPLELFMDGPELSGWHLFDFVELVYYNKVAEDFNVATQKLEIPVGLLPKNNI